MEWYISSPERKYCQCTLLYPAKPPFINEGTIKTIHDR
jgi:hypothetical protein